MSQDAVDVEELIIEWVKNRIERWPKSEKKLKKLACKDIPSTDINWKYLRCSQETKWHDEKKATIPKSHVLFSAVFANANESGDPQTHNLKTERSTRSSCTIQVTKGMTYGGEVSVKIGPPNPIIEANAGFKTEYEMEKSHEATFEEQLTWSVDSDVQVPAKTETIAELVLEEDEYEGSFTQVRCFEGDIHVAVRSKKDKSVIATEHADIADILENQKGFKIDREARGRPKVMFETKGIVKCHYGIRQHLRMSQRPIIPKK